jgi:hypothetical protein
MYVLTHLDLLRQAERAEAEGRPVTWLPEPGRWNPPPTVDEVELPIEQRHRWE